MTTVAVTSAVAASATDVPTLLTHQFICRLKSRQVTPEDAAVAGKALRHIRFDEFEEKSAARLMTFDCRKADSVIDHFCKSYALPEDAADSLKMAACHLDSDRSAETWIKFHKGAEGEFFVSFVAMQRIADKIHMGLARHHVKFRLAPFAYESGSHEYAFHAWWTNCGRPRDEDEASDEQQPEPLNLQELNLLENFFLLKAMRRFVQDFPPTRSQLPAEDAVYLT